MPGMVTRYLPVVSFATVFVIPSELNDSVPKHVATGDAAFSVHHAKCGVVVYQAPGICSSSSSVCFTSSPSLATLAQPAKSERESAPASAKTLRPT
jgi:hypothetical protein